MRLSCWTTCLLLAAPGMLIPFASAKANEQAAGKQAVDTSLSEREVRREYLRLGALMGNRDHWKRARRAAFRPEAVVREGDRDPADFALRTSRALLEDLSCRDPARHWTLLQRELSGLEAQGAAVDVAGKAERFALYRRVCELRRRIAFSNPLLDFGRVVFVTRRLAVANHMCDQYYGNFARCGGGLFVLEEPFGSSPRVRNVLEGSTVDNGRLRGRPLEGGSFLQPSLSYDGKTVLFAYTECGLSPFSPRPDDPAWGVEMKETKSGTAAPATADLPMNRRRDS